MKEYLKTVSNDALRQVVKNWRAALAWYEEQGWKTAPGIMRNALTVAQAECENRGIAF